jgi:hypothetical protein
MIRNMLKRHARKVVSVIGRRIVRENTDAANSLAQQIQRSLILDYRKARQDGRTYFSKWDCFWHIGQLGVDVLRSHLSGVDVVARTIWP